MSGLLAFCPPRPALSLPHWLLSQIDTVYYTLGEVFPCTPCLSFQASSTIQPTALADQTCTGHPRPPRKITRFFPPKPLLSDKLMICTCGPSVSASVLRSWDKYALMRWFFFSCPLLVVCQFLTSIILLQSKTLWIQSLLSRSLVTFGDICGPRLGLFLVTFFIKRCFGFRTYIWWTGNPFFTHDPYRSLAFPFFPSCVPSRFGFQQGPMARTQPFFENIWEKNTDLHTLRLPLPPSASFITFFFFPSPPLDVRLPHPLLLVEVPSPLGSDLCPALSSTLFVFSPFPTALFGPYFVFNLPPPT